MVPTWFNTGEFDAGPVVQRAWDEKLYSVRKESTDQIDADSNSAHDYDVVQFDTNFNVSQYLAMSYYI